VVPAPDRRYGDGVDVMYIRFVRLKIQPERVWDFGQFYKVRSIPALKGVDGCHYATLLRGRRSPDECVSMTIWESRKHADAYEEGGLYQQLLTECEPYLAESVEWKVELVDGLPTAPEAVQKPPEVAGHEVAASKDDFDTDTENLSRLHVRIVTIKVQAGKFEELKKRYTEFSVPAMNTIEGCRHAFLVEGMGDRNQALSITIWDNEAAATRYEMSGAFDDLTRKLRNTFSELYTWRLASQSAGKGRKEITADDLDVATYKVVAGEKF
jgi:heme-degrading monooxygenase HmoA